MQPEYVCEGEASEKLEWFKTINIAGKPLNEQEKHRRIPLSHAS